MVMMRESPIRSARWTKSDYSDGIVTSRAELTARGGAHKVGPPGKRGSGMTDSTGGSYTRTAIALHWLAAVLIVCNLALGISMINVPLSPQKLRLYNWHKWIGITVFLTATVRILWRLGHRAPPPVAMPDWQRRATSVTHAALYVLMFAIPLSGWIYSSATGVSVVYLGLVPLPDLVPKDKTLAAVLAAVHATLNFTLFMLVFVHAWAALRHQFVDRDETLPRMLPFLRRNPAKAAR